jgi:hypothetical protein
MNKVVNRIFGFFSMVPIPEIAALKLAAVNPIGPMVGSGILIFFFIATVILPAPSSAAS